MGILLREYSSKAGSGDKVVGDQPEVAQGVEYDDFGSNPLQVREMELFKRLNDVEWDIFNLCRVEMRGITQFWSESRQDLVDVRNYDYLWYRNELYNMRVSVYCELGNLLYCYC
jgi:hypothetical protein